MCPSENISIFVHRAAVYSVLLGKRQIMSEEVNIIDKAEAEECNERGFLQHANKINIDDKHCKHCRMSGFRS